MNTVATNIRFPYDEYQEIKLLAFSQGQSVAQVIRTAVFNYKRQKLGSKKQISLVEKMRKISVKIDVPVSDLVKEGRKFS